MDLENFEFKGLVDAVIDDSVKKEKQEVKLNGLVFREIIKNPEENFISYYVKFNIIYVEANFNSKYFFHMSDYLLFKVKNYVLGKFKKYISYDGVLETKTIDDKSYVLILNLKNYEFKTIHFYIDYQHNIETKIRPTDNRITYEKCIINMNNKLSELESLSTKIDKLLSGIDTKI
jgi:hypothetical protein